MGALDGSVKIPGMGDVPKKNAAIAGAVVVGIVGVSWWRKRQTNAATAAAASDTGGLVQDPNASFDTSAVGPGGTPVTTGGDLIPAPINLQNPGIITNQDWKSAGSGLDLGGIDSSVIAAALSKVLGNVPVSQDEMHIFMEVSGEIGYPPQGYPPPRLTTTGPGTPPPTTTPPAKKLTNTHNAVNQSMLQIEEIAHGKADLTGNETRALEAIHYNIANGHNHWPAGVAGKDLINRRFTGTVYVV